MSEFLSPIDIGNRGLQHVGSARMDPVLGFNEDSKRATEVAFAYGKLRQAELQRNVWAFAIKNAVVRAIDGNTMVLAPTLWNANTTYYVGSIVADQNNNLWISNIPDNLGNDPLGTTFWEPYFGPMSVSLWDTSGTTGYVAGELVYTAAGDGTYRVYLSLVNDNTDNPATATAWSSSTTYFKDQVATFNSIAYQSLIDLNINQEPDLSPAAWAVGTTYASGNKVRGSDGVTYQSSVNGNVGHDPTADAGVHWTNTGVLAPWATGFVGGAGSINWLEVGGPEFPYGVGLTKLNIIWPIGSGPSTQSGTRNVFMQPAGFLRAVSGDPKVNPVSFIGAPTGIQYRDWQFVGRFITSMEPTALVVWFVADIVDVTQMHAMFCEGLGCRIGVEVCEPLTQSTAKIQQIEQQYQKFMGDARTVNAILVGYEDPPLDDYVACRY
jgi:hypothetical protein